MKRWAFYSVCCHPLTRQLFDGMVKEICNALMEADVNIKLVSGLRKSIRNSVNFKEIGPGVNKKRLIQKVRSPAGIY
jgi:signal recognition particle subunit SRP54